MNYFAWPIVRTLLLLGIFPFSPVWASGSGTAPRGCEGLLLGRRQILVPLDPAHRQPIRVAVVQADHILNLIEQAPEIKRLNEAGFFTVLFWDQTTVSKATSPVQLDHSIRYAIQQDLRARGAVVHYYDFAEPFTTKPDQTVTDVLSAILRAEYGARTEIEYEGPANPEAPAAPKKGGRFFSPISPEDFRKQIQSILGGDDGIYGLVEKLKTDLKVTFDLENYDWEMGFGDSSSIVGYQTLPSGLQYFGVTAGGDWETPIFFLVYWDGKKLRGYVPTEGNPWNTTTKTAYGNDEAKDAKNLVSRYPYLVNGRSREEVEEIAADLSGRLGFEPDKIRKDILERIRPR